MDQIKIGTISFIQFDQFIYLQFLIAYPEVDQFVSQLLGQTFTQISRRGKFLNFNFESGDRLSVHLRMTGQVLVMPNTLLVEKHTHVIFTLTGNRQLRYIDTRRFGKLWYIKADEADTVTGQGNLGLEPDDPGLTAEYLMKQLKRWRLTIKEALLEQSIVAGIGNIYASEILFAAGIYPGTPCCDLTESQWSILAEKIPVVIAWAIDKNQVTPQEYLLSQGKEYRNTPYLRVYNRSGQPCLTCQTPIECITLGKRSSYYCPACQK